MSSAPNDTYYNYNFGNDNQKKTKKKEENPKAKHEMPHKICQI